MVDALRRASRLVSPSGVVVDIHPTGTRARLEVGSTIIGPIDAGDAPLRHEAATAALTAAVNEGFLRIELAREFDFHTYGETPEEVAEYVEENWRNARIDRGTVDRARDALRSAPGARPRVRERVLITILRP